jgi:hypothetical protein
MSGLPDAKWHGGAPYADKTGDIGQHRTSLALALAAKLMLAVAGGFAGLTVGYLLAIASGMATCNC